MTKVIAGRNTHEYDGELVVFHIGMQINRWWRPDLWLPVFSAMPRMLRELSTEPDSGFLGYELLLGAGGPYVVQYWSSAELLYA
ncbi:MAG: monooxygenase family protein, partial [Microbacterium sp.]